MTRQGVLRLVAAVIGAFAVLLAARSLTEGPRTIDVRKHHLVHAVLIIGGAASALALATASPRPAPRPERPGWLVPALLAPLVGMVLMVPTFYPYLNTHPLAHSLAHLGFVVAGFVTAGCGERYRIGIGWAMTLFFEVMAVAAAFGFGVPG